jgi:hypothetical protein
MDNITENITIPKRYRNNFTPEENVLFNQYVAAYKREYRQREYVKAKQAQYKRVYRARKKLEMEQLKVVC